VTTNLHEVSSFLQWLCSKKSAFTLRSICEAYYFVSKTIEFVFFCEKKWPIFEHNSWDFGLLFHKIAKINQTSDWSREIVQRIAGKIRIA